MIIENNLENDEFYDFVKVSKAAEIAGCSVQTIRRACANGSLDYQPLTPRYWRVTLQSLRNWDRKPLGRRPASQSVPSAVDAPPTQTPTPSN